MTRRLAVLIAIFVLGVVCASPTLNAQVPMRSTWDGIYTDAQAGRGKDLFFQNCAKCHGGTLDGNDEIPALKGSHFMADWESQSVAELISRVHITMPMDNPGALSISSATSIVAYLLQQNQMPAGSVELVDDLATQIRIDPEKPGTDHTRN